MSLASAENLILKKNQSVLKRSSHLKQSMKYCCMSENLKVKSFMFKACGHATGRGNVNNHKVVSSYEHRDIFIYFLHILRIVSKYCCGRSTSDVLQTESNFSSYSFSLLLVY